MAVVERKLLIGTAPSGLLLALEASTLDERVGALRASLVSHLAIDALPSVAP